MANTKQGIYYQDNYSSVADVPSDMKKMAESIDAELENDRGRLSTNETKITELQSDNETNKTNISNLQSDNATNKSNIQALQADNTINKQDISNIKTEQTTQNTNIEQNKSDIANINEEIANINKKDTAQDTNIETLTKRLTEKENQIAELEDKVSDLNNNQICGKASGEYVHLSDSAKMNCEISVLGNSRQNVTEQGKNLLDSSKYIIDSSDVTYENGEITIANLNYWGFHGVQFDLSFLKPSTQYTLSLEAMVSKGTNYIFRIINNSSSYIEDIDGLEKEYTKKTVTFSTPTDVSTFKLCLDTHMIYDTTAKTPAKGEEIKKYRNICIKEGTDTTYEPFVPDSPSIKYPSEIEAVSSANVKVCNKNIEDNEFEFGSIDSTTGELMESNWNLRNKNFIRIKPNQKYIMRAVEYSGIKVINTACRYYDRNKKYLGNYFISGLEYGKKEFMITDENVAFCKFVHLNSEEIPSNYTLKIQLEEDNETDYVEHEEQNYPVDMQEPFRAINDVRDCFVLKEDGKWYERHKVGEYIFKGTEEINYNSGNVIAIRCLKNMKKESYTSGYSNIAVIRKSWNELLNNYNSFALTDLQNDGVYDTFWYNISSISSKTNEEILKMLKGNYVIFPLETPTDIECTEQQTQQLNALQKAKTYKNITNITTDTIAVLDVDYKKDLETYQKQQDDRITAIEQLLSTTATSAMLLDNVQSDLESEVK